MCDCTDARYRRQQAAINKIAAKLGVVAYRPDYHRTGGDKNTVLLYTRQDEEHNRKVDRQPIRYSRSEAQDRGVDINSECVYRDFFWAFENSDANGWLDMDVANYGSLNLQTWHWEERLEGSIRYALARKRQNEYVRASGGIWGLQEADDLYNDLNRERLQALKMMHGRLFLGNVNFYNDKREKIAVGTESVYDELLDQPVYNFEYSFAVPTADEMLGEMIRLWNRDGVRSQKTQEIESIIDRIGKLGGINLIWY